MKKLMIAAAAVASLTAIADITSSNVVGYFQKTQPAFKDQARTLVYPTGIISFQWNKVDGSTKMLNEILKCNVGVDAFDVDDVMMAGECIPGWYNNAPKLQVRESTGDYTTLYYTKKGVIDSVWQFAEGWADLNGFIDENSEIALGQGAWFSSPIENAVLTIAGAVATEEVAVGGDSSNATLLAGGGFPVEFAVNGENVTWTCTGIPAFDVDDVMMAGECIPGWYNNAPKLQVRESTGDYTTLYYTNKGVIDSTWQFAAGWADVNGFIDEVTVVQVGGGFWMNTPNQADKGKIFVTVKNPLVK